MLHLKQYIHKYTGTLALLSQMGNAPEQATKLIQGLRQAERLKKNAGSLNRAVYDMTGNSVSVHNIAPGKFVNALSGSNKEGNAEKHLSQVAATSTCVR